MAPKHRNATTPSSVNTKPNPLALPAKSPSKSPSPLPPQTPTPSSLKSNKPQDILLALWDSYERTTPQRVKLIDAFMAFLVAVAVLQFLYVVLAGNYPFNAFLAGFSATVGQFVLTASLRIQTNPENKKEFAGTSNERAFADFVLGSLILHFFCVNFIN